jgi:hypothetical protein
MMRCDALKRMKINHEETKNTKKGFDRHFGHQTEKCKTEKCKTEKWELLFFCLTFFCLVGAGGRNDD